MGGCSFSGGALCTTNGNSWGYKWCWGYDLVLELQPPVLGPQQPQRWLRAWFQLDFSFSIKQSPHVIVLMTLTPFSFCKDILFVGKQQMSFCICSLLWPGSTHDESCVQQWRHSQLSSYTKHLKGNFCFATLRMNLFWFATGLNWLGNCDAPPSNYTHECITFMQVFMPNAELLLLLIISFDIFHICSNYLMLYAPLLYINVFLNH